MNNVKLFHNLRHCFSAELKDEQHSIALAHELSKKICQFDDNKNDQQIIQAINLFDLITKDFNIQFMRQAEIQGFSFPELSKILNDQEIYVIAMYHLKHRQNIISEDYANNKEKTLKLIDDIFEDVQQITLTPDEYTYDKIAQMINLTVQTASLSTGTNLEEVDLEFMVNTNNKTYELLKNKKNILKFLDETLNILCPNTNTLIGPLTTSRLIDKAGSLSKLSKAPSSTVQLFGAEKALFRVLKKKGTRTPKYGILYSSLYVSQPRNTKIKGRVARCLANCVSRCSRVDQYSKESNNNYGKAMKKLMDERVQYYEGKTKKMLRTKDLVIKE